MHHESKWSQETFGIGTKYTFALRFLREIMAKRQPFSVWPVDNHNIHHTCIRYFIPQRGELNVVSNTNPHESIPISITDGCRSRQILWAQWLRMFYGHWPACDTVMIWRDEINTYDSLSTHGQCIILRKIPMRNGNPYQIPKSYYLGILCFLPKRTWSTAL